MLPYASAVALATFFEYVSTGEDSWQNSPELKGIGSEGTGLEGTGLEGTERVRTLIDSLPHHKYWNTLIPALIGVSKEEFEVGLKNFLKERYGVAP